ncbi:MAG: hypothetical protein JO252_11305, partial [Planctomycetaceae bacterium]|nr:hypothetical protein [Planctomycetaceae bacterium]
MKFLTDVGELAVVLELDDTEPAEVDLTRDGLGDAGLDAAVEGMLGSHRAQAAPDGAPWAPLKAATVRRKGHATIGVQPGTLLDPHRWRTAPRDLMPRVAIWYYPSTDGKGDGCDGHARAFHAGHPRTGSPARPILGWTPAAQATCRR